MKGLSMDKEEAATELLYLMEFMKDNQALFKNMRQVHNAAEEAFNSMKTLVHLVVKFDDQAVFNEVLIVLDAINKIAKGLDVFLEQNEQLINLYNGRLEYIRREVGLDDKSDV